MKKKGTNMVLIDSAGAGDIVSMAGLMSPSIGHTVANVEVCFYAIFFFLFLIFLGCNTSFCCVRAACNISLMLTSYFYM